MMESNVIEEAATATVRGIAQDQARRVRDRIEPPADQLKEDAADRVESVAEQVRELGQRLDRRDEAHAIARRLERTADYLRFRPARDVASDAWETVTRPGVLWFAGGAVAALVAYRVFRNSSLRSTGK